MQIIHTENAPKAIGPYSQAIRVDKFLYCSGQVPLIPSTMQLIEGGIEAQTEQVFKNISAVLKEAGASLNDVVKTTVFLKNLADFAKMNAVYAKSFGEHKPARSTIEVSRLPVDALVEIECVVVLK